MSYWNSQKGIDRVTDYRSLPDIKRNSPCEVDGKKGIIYGGNSSANFNVKFETGQVMNCHPNYRMTIWDDEGNLLHKGNDN